MGMANATPLDGLYDFDELIERRPTDSTKWHHFGPEVLSLWTADMDFRGPAPVQEALQQRVAHGIFGYCFEPPMLRRTIVERLAALYSWEVRPEEILFQTGVVGGLYRLCHAVAGPQDAILMMPPVYPPIAGAAWHNGSVPQELPLLAGPDGQALIDFERLEQTITPQTRLLILCNPHNPVGRVFLPSELRQLGQLCLRRGVLVCSDEIHCDLLFTGQRHTPMASLGPDLARNTVTFMAPSKTFNMPGLRCSFAIVQDPDLRRRLGNPHSLEFAEVNTLGFVAAQASYALGGPWLAQLLPYLEANRNLVQSWVENELPGMKMTLPQATYLAWLDCRHSAAAPDPYRFFLERAGVGLADGREFGTGGEGFVRLNFACPRARLQEALARMTRALAG
jgi:cystathionine beta-lyase